MSKPWQPQRMWDGQAVAIIANGPQLTSELAAQARATGAKTIAVNRGVRVAPWTDLFIALDPEHHAGVECDGLRVVGIDCDVDALYPGLMYECVTLGEGHSIEIRNNLLAALRLAAGAGAAQITLYAVDTVAYEALHDFRGVTEGLATLIAELRARGIEVEFADGEISTENEPVNGAGEDLPSE